MKIGQTPQCYPESLSEECDQNLSMKGEGLSYSSGENFSFKPGSLDYLQIFYFLASDNVRLCHPAGDPSNLLSCENSVSMMLFSTACPQVLLLCILEVSVGLIVKKRSKYWDFEFSKLDLNNHHFNLHSFCTYYKQSKYAVNFKLSSFVLLI